MTAVMDSGLLAFARPRNDSSPPWRGLLRRAVRIDDIAGLIFRRVDNGLDSVGSTELLEAVSRYVVKLDLHHPRFRPFAVRPEFHVADDGLERSLMHVGGKLAVIETLGRR